MADYLKDGEFWLPPQFLTDDEVPMTNNKRDFSKPYLASSLDSFGFSPDLSSPVESIVGSTETESDEEDYLAELTRQMAHSTLEDFSRKPNYGVHSEHAKGRGLAGSPQSTLCGGAVGCGCRRHGSSRGSPNGSSPLPTTWDLLCAAAGEVSMMPYSESRYYSNQALSRQRQLQNMKEEYVRKQLNQVVWGGGQVKGGSAHYQMANQNRSCSRPMGMAWPSLQQTQQLQNGSAMRAMFLGSNGSRKECAGTGVFLPRRAGYPSEPRKKSACSTVLVPARVAQALNLKLDDMGGAQTQCQKRFNGSFSNDGDVALRLHNGNKLPAQQKQTIVRAQQGMNHEIRLPQEWTY